MQKHQFLVLGSCLFFSLARAQSGSVAAGGNATGATGTVSYSLGQVDYINSSASAGNVNQGLQQPYEILTSSVQDVAGTYGITVYPNPATHMVYIRFTQLPEGSMYQLYNTLGQPVATAVITENPTGIPMENYAPGTYVLQLIHHQTTLQTNTIIKK